MADVPAVFKLFLWCFQSKADVSRAGDQNKSSILRLAGGAGHECLKPSPTHVKPRLKLIVRRAAWERSFLSYLPGLFLIKRSLFPLDLIM